MQLATATRAALEQAVAAVLAPVTAGTNDGNPEIEGRCMGTEKGKVIDLGTHLIKLLYFSSSVPTEFPK